jgi:protocatechuate 3,4-dioxygenase beta subunit
MWVFSMFLLFGRWCFTSIVLVTATMVALQAKGTLSRPATKTRVEHYVHATSRGVIQGTVKDNRGGPVRGATITLTCETGQRQTTETANDGSYVIRGILPGTYLVSANGAGLEPATVPLVNVEPGQVVTGNVTMIAESAE